MECIEIGHVTSQHEKIIARDTRFMNIRHHRVKAFHQPSERTGRL